MKKKTLVKVAIVVGCLLLLNMSFHTFMTVIAVIGCIMFAFKAVRAICGLVTGMRILREDEEPQYKPAESEVE